MYFNKVTEQKIVEYNNSTDYDTRNYIFEKYIYVPFYTIVKSLIHRYKHKYYCIIEDSIDNLIHDVIGHMVNKMHKYNPESGKAFSYFSIIAKHYLTEKWYKYNKYFEVSPDEQIIQNRPKYDVIIDSDFINEKTLQKLILFLNTNKYEISHMEHRIEIIEIIINLLTEVQNNTISTFKTNKFVIEYIIEKLPADSNISAIEIKRTLNILKKYFIDVKNEKLNLLSIDYIK